MADGGYEPVAERLFNKLNVDGFFLEYDTPRAGDFTPLRFVPKGAKRVALGLVSTKLQTWKVPRCSRTNRGRLHGSCPSSSYVFRRNAALPVRHGQVCQWT